MECDQAAFREVSVNSSFVVDCDASAYGLRAVIQSQRQNRNRKVIAFASWVLEDHEGWNSTTKNEMLAMVQAISSIFATTVWALLTEMNAWNASTVRLQDWTPP